MKHVRFIPHAESAILDRKIERAWVMETLLNPERLENHPVLLGRKRAFRRIAAFGDRGLRVVYDTTGDETEIVTAFFDRKAGRRQ